VLRWGFLGAGAVATDVAPALRADSHDLAVVSAPALGRARAFAAQQGVRRARADYDEVLSAADVDAVCVDLPAEEREEWITAALRAGKHVLSAPPFGPDAAAAGRVAAVAAGEQRVVMDALPARFHPRMQALLEASAGARMLVATIADAGTLPAVAALLPAVAVARWVIGEHGVRVQGSCSPTAVAAVLDFDSGAVATVAAVTGASPHQSLDVVTPSATLRAPWFVSATRAHDAVLERDGEVVATWRADPLQAMVRAFAEAVAGRPSPLPADDTIATLQVLDAIRAH
jgi:predicted dehydrogenase